MGGWKSSPSFDIKNKWEKVAIVENTYTNTHIKRKTLTLEFQNIFVATQNQSKTLNVPNFTVNFFFFLN